MLPNLKIITDNINHRQLFILLAGLMLLAAFPVLAAEDTEAGLNWGSMGMKLIGGLALFLFGMEQMTDALKSFDEAARLRPRDPRAAAGVPRPRRPRCRARGSPRS